MGVSEDCEPPLKRVKLPLIEADRFQLQLFRKESLAFTLGNSMARPLTAPRNSETVGSQGVIKRTEFVKIITRALYSLGYEKTGALLEEESGIPLHSPVVKLFVQQLMNGKWGQSVETLRGIDILTEQTMKSASFLILEQKFFELLKEDNVVAALETLRNEIAPLNTNFSRINELASCLICPSRCSALGKEDEGSKIVEKLQKLLPPDVLIPDQRLEHLVEKALDMQRDGCVFHNTLDSDLSLYSDHQCGRSQIPSQTIQILEEHTDEVWFVQFSYNGKYLASASKDQLVIIWEVREDGRVHLKHKLEGHSKPIPFLSWSPKDERLLTCGHEEVIRCWDANTGRCIRVFERAGTGPVSCGWFPNNRGVFAGLTDKSICLWDLEGRELECWKGHRTLKSSDLAITSDGKRIISTCRDTTILLFDWEAKQERFIEADDVVTSFSLSHDSKMLLVNLSCQEIHLWNIEGIPRIVSKYKGLIRTRFVIRSCFGGFEQAFIASGSEDSQVYIWHRSTGELVWKLPGHSGSVNCVSWNPRNLQMLASSSDDRTIRIWGLTRFPPFHSNGSFCNGNPPPL